MSPEFSFIVPVRNDAIRLRRCLTSIRASLGNVPAEIIVADNGSTDDSDRVGQEAGARVMHLPDRRVSQVRNDGAAEAAGEWIAFVDADNELAPAWVKAAREAMRDPSVALAGAQYHAPADGTWVQLTYDLLRDHRPNVHPARWLPSGNIVVRRSTFAELGGFDVSLETCEDVDLCQRVSRGGHSLLTVPEMRSVHHGDPATLAALFRGELWRGRDSLRVSLRGPISVMAMVGAALPILTLLAWMSVAAGLAGAWLGLWPLAAAGGLWLAALAGARAVVMTRRAASSRRGLPLLARAWIVSVTYDAARALSLVVRSGHGVRQRA